MPETVTFFGTTFTLTILILHLWLRAGDGGGFGVEKVQRRKSSSRTQSCFD